MPGGDNGDDKWAAVFDDDFAAGGPVELSADERQRQADRARAAHRKRLRKERRRAGRPKRIKFAGAVAALAAAVVAGFGLSGRGPLSALQSVNEGATGTTSLGVGTTSTTESRLSLRDFRTGDCVIWDEGDNRYEHATSIVPCDEPHYIEIGAVKRITDGPDHVPTVDEWRAIVKKECEADIESWLGTRFDPMGRFRLGALQPTTDGWLAGDRTLWCGVEANPSSPLPLEASVPFTGEVRGAPQALVLPVGTCVSTTGPFVVDCTAPHDSEITGSVDLTGRVATPPPAADRRAWSELVSADCTRLATDYLGHPPVDPIVMVWFAIDPVSWDLGNHSARCGVSHFTAGRPDTVTGPIRAAGESGQSPTSGTTATGG